MVRNGRLRFRRRSEGGCPGGVPDLRARIRREAKGSTFLLVTYRLHDLDAQDVDDPFRFVRPWLK